MSDDSTPIKMKLSSMIDDWYIKDRRVQRYGFLNLKSFSSQQQFTYHESLKYLKEALTLSAILVHDKKLLQRAWQVASRDICNAVSNGEEYDNVLLRKVTEINKKIKVNFEQLSPSVRDKVRAFTERCLYTMVEGGGSIAQVSSREIQNQLTIHSSNTVEQPPVLIDVTRASHQGKPSPSLVPSQIASKPAQNTQSRGLQTTSQKVKINVQPSQSNHVHQRASLDSQRSLSTHTRPRPPRKSRAVHISLNDAHRILFITFYNFVSKFEIGSIYTSMTITDRAETLGRLHSIVKDFQQGLSKFDDTLISKSRLDSITSQFENKLNEAVDKVVRDSKTIQSVKNRLYERCSLYFRSDYRHYFPYAHQLILFKGVIEIQLKHIRMRIRQKYGYLNAPEYQYQVNTKFNRSYIEQLRDSIQGIKPFEVDDSVFDPNPVSFDKIKEYVFTLMQKYNTTHLGYAQMSMYTSQLELWLNVLKEALDNSPHPSVSVQLANWFTKMAQDCVVSAYNDALKIDLKSRLSSYDNHISTTSVEDSFVKVYGSLMSQPYNRLIHDNDEFKIEMVELKQALMQEVKGVSKDGRVNIFTYRFYHEVVFPQYIKHVINGYR